MSALKKSEISKLLDAILDDLAAVEHDRWAHWQDYMHSKGTLQTDGSLVLPRELVERWQSQMTTKFAQLSEAEKESDREQVRHYLPLILTALTESRDPSNF